MACPGAGAAWLAGRARGSRVRGGERHQDLLGHDGGVDLLPVHRVPVGVLSREKHDIS